MKGVWARSVYVAIAGDERPTSPVEDLRVEIGRLTARVGECEVTLGAERIPRSTWVSMVRFAHGMGPLEEAVKGRLQSPHLEVLLAEDWDEQLIPRPGQIRRTCSCDESGRCEHVAAVGLAFADAIDDDPRLLLRWRGCVDEDEEAEQADPWLGGALPVPRAPRGLPAGAVLKRLGPSGIQVGDEDLAEVLEVAYEAFGTEPRRAAGASAARPRGD
jgi:hypothetical protein